MGNFLGLGSRKKSSGSIAKERLKLVLVHDRSGLTPQQLDALKDELLKVIAKYVDIDQEGVEINLAQNQRESRLQADIPIRAAERRRRRALAEAKDQKDKDRDKEKERQKDSSKK
jgi:cell division topological specificity factor